VRIVATILIVDDDPAIRKLLGAVLVHGGHRLLEAHDGAHALKCAQVDRPDLVITDVLMPTMDGYEFVRQLRANATLAQTPVIFCTAAYHEREARALARACGVRQLLTKPCQPADLVRAVGEVLGAAAEAPTPTAPANFERKHRRLLTNKLAEKVRELAASNARLEALVTLGRQLALERDPLRLVESYCRGAREILGARYAAIGLLNDEQQLRPFFLSGLEGEAASAVLPPEPDYGLVHQVLTRRRVRVPDLAAVSGAVGFAPPHPCEGAFLGVAIASPGQLHGLLYLLDKVGTEEFTSSDEELAVTLAAQVGVAYLSVRQYENIQRHAVRLQDEAIRRWQAEQDLHEYSERLQSLSRRLMLAQETERRRLARELHDEIGQELTAVQINLRGVRQRANETALTAPLDESLTLIGRILEQVRNLSLDLRPSVLDDFGLMSALRWYLDRHARRTGLDIQLMGEPFAARLEPDVETACFRVAQEALTNIVRHAQARQVRVEVRREPDGVHLVLRDDGVGFDVQAARDRASRGGSLGLLGMQERIASLGGNMEIDSAEGKGTEIRVHLPLERVPQG
jgi:signal transduction histidine kinase